MLKVLIVDNEAAIRKGLAHCISWEDIGCTIVGQASDGIEALEKVEELDPNIIISDIRMPGMDGLALAEHLNRERPDVKVILLTGYPDFTYAQNAITFGVVDFVLKPTSVESLTSAVQLAKQRIEEDQSSRDIVRKLENQAEQNIRLQRSLFLNDLIHQNDLSVIYTLHRIGELKLEIASYHVLRVFIRLLNADEIDFLPVQQEAHALIASCLEPFPVYFVPRGTQSSYVVVGTSDTQKLLASCVEAADIVGNLLRFSVSIGISSLQRDPMQMPAAAQEARQAQQFAAYSPGSSALFYEHIPAVEKEDLAAISEDLKRLRTSLSNRREDALVLLDDIFAHIRAARLPMREVEKIGSYIYHSCVELLAFRDSPEGLSEIPSMEQLFTVDTIDGLDKALQLFLSQMLHQSNHNPEDAREVIQNVQTYIRRHYQDDLTLEMLAKLVFLSPSYLSKLFKKETGENLSNYIQNQRIERAKELLLTTQLKSYEVAEQVGIPNPVYFSRLFKKMTGLKPKDYRLENTK